MSVIDFCIVFLDCEFLLTFTSFLQYCVRFVLLNLIYSEKCNAPEYDPKKCFQIICFVVEKIPQMMLQLDKRCFKSSKRDFLNLEENF